ncbi:hypothetical protein Dret_0365 [Desulfohalobium retbaense DSM 5692]|uniref:Uncharacterized protein n=1 Tax=Desulfohalobium retbaense (strain ATCC 49708 / DSM 5692 / JCM 16813 / HR100) TaxID=485915 RepID=C8X042_DESRD|nr:hypothetical protein Dret_0365 [Desulfohalobium retbaense DSM 5692]
MLKKNSSDRQASAWLLDEIHKDFYPRRYAKWHEGRHEE